MILRLDYCNEMMEKAEKLGKKLLLPSRYSNCSTDFPNPIDAEIETMIVAQQTQFLHDKEGLDIGPKTRELIR